MISETSFNGKDFPQMILNGRVQEKISCFDTWVPDIQRFLSDNVQCPTAMSIPASSDFQNLIIWTNVHFSEFRSSRNIVKRTSLVFLSISFSMSRFKFYIVLVGLSRIPLIKKKITEFRSLDVKIRNFLYTVE